MLVFCRLLVAHFEPEDERITYVEEKKYYLIILGILIQSSS
jgi:hypothetical protein